MAAALCALYELVRLDPKPYRNLVPSFVSILKQVAEHRLPKAFEYHKTPAPFIQVHLCLSTHSKQWKKHAWQLHIIACKTWMLPMCECMHPDTILHNNKTTHVHVHVSQKVCKMLNPSPTSSSSS